MRVRTIPAVSRRTAVRLIGLGGAAALASACQPAASSPTAAPPRPIASRLTREQAGGIARRLAGGFTGRCRVDRFRLNRYDGHRHI
jgi:hypothetical protein